MPTIIPEPEPPPYTTRLPPKYIKAFNRIPAESGPKETTNRLLNLMRNNGL